MPQRGFMCRLGLVELSASVSARKVVAQNDIMGYPVNFVSVRASRSDFTLQIPQLFFKPAKKRALGARPARFSPSALGHCTYTLMGESLESAVAFCCPTDEAGL